VRSEEPERPAGQQPTVLRRRELRDRSVFGHAGRCLGEAVFHEGVGGGIPLLVSKSIHVVLLCHARLQSARSSGEHWAEERAEHASWF
jgi:hypothetical protein